MKFLLTCLLITIHFVQAQSYIKGKVIEKNGKPVYLANVYLDGTYDGTTTDSLGNFVFETNEQGIRVLTASFLGRPAYHMAIQLPLQTPLVIKLAETDNRLQEVQIQAGVLQANSSGKNTVMTPLDIVSTAGAMGNIIGALATLPGAQVAGENGRLMVHGGDASETQTYINGLRVPQPYTATPNEVPVRGRFSPMLFKGVNFSTGGYSAEFGNALSSILSLNTANKIEAPKSDLSISSVGLGAGNTSRWGDNSITVNASYTNLKPYSNIITPDIEWTKPYESASGEAVYRNQLSNGFLNIYAAYTAEYMGLYQADINHQNPVSIEKTTRNSYLNMDYTQDLGKRWNLQSGISFGYLSDHLKYNMVRFPNQEKALHIKEKISKIWNNNVKSIFGIEYFDDTYTAHYNDQQEDIQYGYHSRMGVLFTETTFALMPDLVGKVGLRTTSANLQQKNLLEPRASLGYILNKYTQLSLAYGKFHQQAPTALLQYSPTLDWLAADHYVANYFYERGNRLLRLEAYYKHYRNLVKYDSKYPAYNSHYDNSGSGKVKGFDLFYRDNASVKNFQYWISYSYTHSKRNEANYPLPVTPSYVFDHTTAIVGKYWISALRSQVSFTAAYLSGRSYDDPNQTTFMTGKTKPYSTTALSWSYLLNQQKIIHFSVSNIFGASPIYGYQYADQANSLGIYERRPILPTAKRFIFIGYFWTISQNQKDNQLDNL